MYFFFLFEGTVYVGVIRGRGGRKQRYLLFLLQKINPACVPLCVLDVFVFIRSCLSSQAGRNHLVTHVQLTQTPASHTNTHP